MPSNMKRGKTTTAPAAPAAALRFADDGEVCPVCKSSRYLNPNMRFLVNPECYHKMCESCVDRIFSHGPAACPIAGCHRTLRKQKFRKQTFGDVQVEREVDIRRRVSQIFNRHEDDFDTLLDYNNYLNEVEDITFNLINKIDVEATERKLLAYNEAHRQDISRNKSRDKAENLSHESRMALEKERIRLRREAAQREDEEVRRQREDGKRDIINKLASGEGDAIRIVDEGRKIVLKQSSIRRAALEKKNAASRAGHDLIDDAGFTFKGLKQAVPASPEEVYDPFGGIEADPQYYVLQEHYDWDWLLNAEKEPGYVVGGYRLEEYYSRALCEAFSGLAVFVSEEKAAIPDPTELKAEKIAAEESIGTKTDDREMSDVF